MIAEQPETISEADLSFFESEVRPLLIQHCLECHGNDREDIRGGLDLASRQGIQQGGDSGSLGHPDRPDESLLLRAVRYEDLEMPPEGKLSDQQIAVLAQWLRRGLPDPRDAQSPLAQRKAVDIEEGRKFWAYQIPKHTHPETTHSLWARTPIDHYIMDGYQAAGIQPTTDAPRSVLARRIHLTLTGLPPTIEQLDDFINDPRDDDQAISALVDELMATHHFGERWGRHWLDVARYAESSGGGRSLMFRNAWRFRDYAIQSLNHDKPYDQMIVEQLAGDQLPYASDSQRSDQLVATSFLVLGPTNYELQDKALLRMEVIDEQIDTIGRAFMGMSLGCARCHDHKFDPIPTSDYYALAGILGSTQTLVFGNVSSFIKAPLPPGPDEQQREQQYKNQIAALKAQQNQISAELQSQGWQHLIGKKGGSSDRKEVSSSDLAGIVIDDTEATLVGGWTQSTSIGTYVDGHYIHDAMESKGDKRVVFEHKITREGLYDVRIAYSASSNRERRVPVDIQHSDGQSTVYVNQQKKPAIDSLFHSVGSYRFKANQIAKVTIDNRDTSSVVIADAVQLLPVEEPAAGKLVIKRRNKQKSPSGAATQLAERWKQIDKEIAKLQKSPPGQYRFAMSVKDVDDPKDGPLHIRGEIRNLGPTVPRGFLQVATPQQMQVPKIEDNTSGRMALARWLASSENPLTARVYVNRIWQHLLGRGIVETSDNHGTMGSRPSHPELLDYLAIELMDNRWSTKRIIREIMTSRVYRLSTANSTKNAALDPENRLLWKAHRRPLDAEVIRDAMLAIGGNLDLQAGGNTIQKYSQYDWGYDFDGFARRSVYVPLFRNALLELFEVFDLANPNLVTGTRSVSTLPTQSLYLLNHPFVIEQARRIADNTLAENESSRGELINELYRRLLGRHATDEELEIALEYIGPEGDISPDALAQFCHILIACVDFRYMQ